MQTKQARRVEIPDPLGRESSCLPRMQERYLLGDPVGQGRWTVVMRAVDREREEEVALKFLPGFLVEEERHFARVVDVLQSSQRLNAPGFVPVWDFGVMGRRPYISMPLLSMCSLHEALARKQANWKEAEVLLLLSLVSEALSQAHKHRLIHLDLKPTNIFLTKEGGLLLSDLGLGRLLLRQRCTMGHEYPFYLAPEIQAGEAATCASDIFSVGMLGVHLLTGRLPWIVHEIPVTQQLGLKQTDERVRQLLAQCLSLDPTQRPGATELSMELWRLHGTLLLQPQRPQPSLLERYHDRQDEASTQILQEGLLDGLLDELLEQSNPSPPPTPRIASSPEALQIGRMQTNDGQGAFNSAPHMRKLTQTPNPRSSGPLPQLTQTPGHRSSGPLPHIQDPAAPRSSGPLPQLTQTPGHRSSGPLPRVQETPGPRSSGPLPRVQEHLSQTNVLSTEDRLSLQDSSDWLYPDNNPPQDQRLRERRQKLEAKRQSVQHGAWIATRPPPATDGPDLSTQATLASALGGFHSPKATPPTGPKPTPPYSPKPTPPNPQAPHPQTPPDFEPFPFQTHDEQQVAQVIEPLLLTEVIDD